MLLKNLFKLNSSFFARNVRFFSAAQAENKVALYTWGKNTGSLGYAVPATNTMSLTLPKKVEEISGKIAKVALGLNHSAVLTSDGNLYTFGSGSYGCLGHNDGDKNHTIPKLVEFFQKNKLKVVDVALGENHTLALTEDGDVWSWGYGGRSTNFIVDLLFSSTGALGHGDSQHRYTPTPIQALRNLPPIRKITTGYRFSLAINVNNELYKWGRGDYGVFGDGNNKSLFLPKKSSFFTKMQSEGFEIVKIKSANNYSMALMKDGNLYAWGSNESGQMGTKTEIGVEIYETANFPTPVVNEDFGSTKIVDFDIGEDVTAILLDNNEVFWCGSKLAYKPERLKLPKDIAKIKQVAVCFRCIAVLTEKNEIYMKNIFVQHKEENIATGITKTDNSLFGNGEILEIGGVYRNRYALVKE